MSRVSSARKMETMETGVSNPITTPIGSKRSATVMTRLPMGCPWDCSGTKAMDGGVTRPV